MKGLLITLIAVLGFACCTEKWTVQDKSGNTCIVVDADTELSLVYPAGNETSTCKVKVINATITGSCDDIRQGNKAQHMMVSFFPNGEVPANMSTATEWILDLVFTNTSSGYQLSEYYVMTSPSDQCEEAKTEKIAMNGTSEVSASQKNAFKCSTSNLPLTKGSVDFKSLRAVAFAQLNGTDFPENQAYDVCFLDSRTSDIVPIIVGACLAGLVVIVLVAYLIGRAKAKRQGYASV